MIKLFWQKYWRQLTIGAIILVALAVAVYTSTFNSLPQSSFSLFDQLSAPVASDRVLVVAPHQDDEVIGAGDYIERSVSVGAKVEIVFATDGNKHGKKAERHDEAIAADAKLGILPNQIAFFDRPDGQLTETNQYSQFVAQLTDAVKAFQPTIIVTTLPSDDHPDHAATGRAVEALTSGVTNAQKWYFLIHADRYPRPIGDKPDAYLLPPIDLVAGYNWDVFSPTPAEQVQKRQAIDAYRSQLSLTNPILRQLLQSFDRRNELFAQTR